MPHYLYNAFSFDVCLDLGQQFQVESHPEKSPQLMIVVLDLTTSYIISYILTCSL